MAGGDGREQEVVRTAAPDGAGEGGIDTGDVGSAEVTGSLKPACRCDEVAMRKAAPQISPNENYVGSF